MDQPSTHVLPLDPDASDINAGDEARIAHDTVSEKLNDAQTPSYQAEFDPDEAESAGAFFDDALSHDDAISSAHDSAHFTPPSSREL